MAGRKRDDGSCVGCGCTDAHACDGGCSWVVPGVCSRCYLIYAGVLVRLDEQIQKLFKLDRRQR